MTYTALHGIICQKTELFIATAVGTSNPTLVCTDEPIRIQIKSFNLTA
jgi:hypothetical protein